MVGQPEVSTIQIWMIWFVIAINGFSQDSRSSSPSRVYTASRFISTSTTSRRCCGSIRHIVHWPSMSMRTSNPSWLCIIASSSRCIISRCSLHIIPRTSLGIISRSSKCIGTSQPLSVISSTPLCIISGTCRCTIARPYGSIITSSCRSWTRLTSGSSNCSSVAAAAASSCWEGTSSLSNKIYNGTLYTIQKEDKVKWVD